MTIGGVGSGASFVSLSGLRDATRRLDAAARTIAGGAVDAGPVVALMVAEAAFAANAAVLGRARRLDRTALDLLA